MSKDEPKRLRLVDALVRWCDPGLVERVREEERKLIPYELQSFGRPKITPPEEWAKPTGRNWMGASACTFLLAAWQNLEDDFARRVEVGELHLEAVRSTPEPGGQPEAIPNAWVSELAFDFKRNIAKRGNQRYLAVNVSRTASTSLPLERAVEAGVIALPITRENVGKLSDDELLTLLEDHARRVVENAEYKALDPGITKVSFMPLILRKMRARAAAGEMRQTLKGEAAWLEKWIQQKAPSHQFPTAVAIENSLRDEYRSLKPQSLTTIP